MREGRKAERRQARRPPILPRGERVLSIFDQDAKARASDSPPACSSRLSHSSALYPLHWVGLMVGSVSHAFVSTPVFIPVNSFQGWRCCAEPYPIVFKCHISLRRVLVLAVRLVRTSSEFIFFPILNQR